jgi:hypothetical protein
MYELPPTPAKKKPRPAHRKSQAVKELEQLLWEADCRRYPSIDPKYIAKRITTDATANGLTKCVVAYAKLRGAFASRLNNTGIFRDGKYTRSTARRGLPDVLVTYKGQSLFVEIKVGKDRMSDHQRKVQEEQRQAGGNYVVIGTFEQFKTWFDEL